MRALVLSVMFLGCSRDCLDECAKLHVSKDTAMEVCEKSSYNSRCVWELSICPPPDSKHKMCVPCSSVVRPDRVQMCINNGWVRKEDK